ncbi:hypothetical protein, partial [Paenibacillus odorifer]|uniref:hypothetical protein n=1 Tax=Paenibacillus odorifer TaxID=189426 RepID=UPI001C4AAD0F
LATLRKISYLLFKLAAYVSKSATFCSILIVSIGPYCSYFSIWVHFAKVSDCIALITLDLHRKGAHLSE